VDETGSAQGNGDVTDMDISADGRYVVFSSTADNLDPADVDANQDVFRRDMETGAVELVSRATGPSGANANGGAGFPTISDDGRYVAFVSSADNLSADDPDTLDDVYVRDLSLNTTELVSRETTAVGAKGTSASTQPAISGDGRSVAFTSDADNLSVDDNDSFANVFVRDLDTETTTLVTRATGAAGAAANQNNSVDRHGISDDGRVVAFSSEASNLDPDDADGALDVFVRDVGADTTELISRASGMAGAKGNSSSSVAAISGDGSVVAFGSFATNLDPDETSGGDVDLFARDRAAATTELISRATGANGVPADGFAARNPDVSGDGRYISFESTATNLDPAATDGSQQQYVRDTTSSTTALVSAANGADAPAVGSQGPIPAISTDGSYAVFATADSAASSEAIAQPALIHLYRRQLAADPPPPPLPPPVQGKAVNAIPIFGAVLVKVPGSDEFIPLNEADQLPTGTIFDLRHGKIRLISSAKGESTRSAVFYGGRVRVSQGDRDGAYTVMKLVGPMQGCGKHKSKALGRSARGRHVWGHGGGGHKSSGHKSSGSVRGTWWLVKDLCNGKTKTRVKKGVVAVRDFERKRTVQVRRGETYIAPGPKHSKGRGSHQR
jgi:Tol biopolymer transport system component